MGLLATFFSIALLPSGVAAADTVTTNFESFHLGSVNGQDGWKSALPGDFTALPHGYDQEVVKTDGGITESLRMSNLYANGEFFHQTYSKVRVYIDGKDVGQWFATWENYYRTAPEQAPPTNVNTPASINRLQLRSSLPAPDLPAGGG